MRTFVSDGNYIYETIKRANGCISNTRTNVTSDILDAVTKFMKDRCDKNQVDHIDLVTEHGVYSFQRFGEENV